MKASELIRLLEDAKARFGDIDVLFSTDHGEFDIPAGYYSVMVDEDGWTRDVSPEEAEQKNLKAVRIELE